MSRRAVAGALAALALLAGACGPRAEEKAAPGPRTEEKAPPARPTGPIRAPDGALLPVVRPPGLGLDARALQRIRRGELYLEGLIAAGGSEAPALAAAYGELGKVYHSFGVPESAIPCYANAARLQPASLEWPYLLARALWGAHRGDEAIAAIGQVLVLQPRDLASLVLLGDIHRAMGRVGPAREAYQRAVSVSSRCAPALYGLGEIAVLEGNSRRAVELFEAALRAQPEATRVHYPLALAYGRLGNAAQAERHLALRGELDPTTPDPIYNAVLLLNPVTNARRGQDALRAGNPSQALEMLRPAVEALPDDPEIRMHLGRALARTGDLEGALEQYSAAVRLQPTNPRAHYNLGTTLTSLGRDDEAVVELRRAIDLQPEFPQALFNLGQAMRRLDRHAEALPFLEQALKVSATHEPARLARARVLARLGRCRDAVASIEEGLTILPQSRPFKGLLARLLAACAADRPADPARALQLAQQVFKEEGISENAASVAFVHAARGEWKEAVRWQRRTLELLPEGRPPDAETAQLEAYEAGKPEFEW